MSVADILDERRAFSFEVFPPKTDVGMEKLIGEGGVLEHLYELNPDYISCTYGAGGGNVGKNLEVLDAIKASGSSDIVGVGFDKSDAILNLISDGYLLATMAQNPDVMGYEGVKAAVAAIGGESLGGEVTDTGVSVVTADSLAGAEAETEAVTE